MKKKHPQTVMIVLAALLIENSYSTTCPQTFKQDPKGFWYSSDSPGWKSHKPTHPDVSIHADHFGGVVYSPKKERLACVYKASDGKWIALVSNIHPQISIDKQATDNSGVKPAWKYNPTHKDYSCGLPSVNKISQCSFQLVE